MLCMQVHAEAIKNIKIVWLKSVDAINAPKPINKITRLNDWSNSEPSHRIIPHTKPCSNHSTGITQNCTCYLLSYIVSICPYHSPNKITFTIKLWAAHFYHSNSTAELANKCK